MNKHKAAVAVAVTSMAAIPVVSKAGGAPLNVAWWSLVATCAAAIACFLVMLRTQRPAQVVTVPEQAAAGRCLQRVPPEPPCEPRVIRWFIKMPPDPGR